MWLEPKLIFVFPFRKIWYITQIYGAYFVKEWVTNYINHVYSDSEKVLLWKTNEKFKWFFNTIYIITLDFSYIKSNKIIH